MWLNKEKTTESAIAHYKEQLSQSCPEYVVIDNLFNHSLLVEITSILQYPNSWQKQRHTYDELYVNDARWHATKAEQRFVQRDVFIQQNFCTSGLQSLPTPMQTSLPISLRRIGRASCRERV